MAAFYSTDFQNVTHLYDNSNGNSFLIVPSTYQQNQWTPNSTYQWSSTLSQFSRIGDSTVQVTLLGTATLNYNYQGVTSGINNVPLNVNTNVPSLSLAASSTKRKLQALLSNRKQTLMSAIPGLMSTIPTFLLSGPGGGGSITTPLVIAYNNQSAVTFRGLLPVFKTQFGSNYWQNACNGLWTPPSFWVEFMHYGTAFELQFRDASSNSMFWVWADIGDGNGFKTATTAPVASGAANPGSSFFYKVTFASAAMRRIRLYMSAADYGGFNVGSTDTITAVENSQQTSIVFLGDSYVDGPASVADTDLFVNRLGEGLGYWCSMYKLGQGGTGYLATGGSSRNTYSSAERISGIVSINPDFIIVLGTINDDANFATVGAAATLFYNTINVQLPNTKIIVVGPQSNNGGPSANRLANNAAVKSAALAASNVIGYVDTLAGLWTTGSGNTGTPNGSGNSDVNIQADGTHLSTVGNIVWANRLYKEVVNILYTYLQS